MAGTAEEVEVAGRKVRLTSADRVIFPKRGFTKGDVFRYYVAVGDGIMRALGERPTTLQRFPDGIDGEMFFQKRVPTRGAPPWVQTARITFPSGRPADELCPADLAHVAWAAQMGTGVVHEVLDDLGWVGYPKTSGGRGVHVYVRIRPQWSFVEVRRAAIALAREAERRRPELITTSWWKEERGERVFVDYNQMARDRTIACAYSLRANQRATVSTPVTWDELPDVEPDDFDLATVPPRLAKLGDPHAGIDDVAHDLTPLLEWAERDARNGLGDQPYPPDHPKMPGEPMRVQPSKARRPSS